MQSSLRIAQLRAEIATASATLYRATAALRALEEKMHDTGSDESHVSHSELGGGFKYFYSHPDPWGFMI